MFTIRYNWHAFNCSLEDCADKLKADYPRPATPNDDLEADPLYFMGFQALGKSYDEFGNEYSAGYLQMCFSKKPTGFNGYEAFGILKTPDVSSETESINNWWTGLTESSDPETVNYYTQSDAKAALQAAKIAAASNVEWTDHDDQQKKILFGVDLNNSDYRALIAKYGSN